VLRKMSREFGRLYAGVGRLSIPPERLLRAQLLQVFYSIPAGVNRSLEPAVPLHGMER
jgi:hypothetical protein